MYIYMQTDTNHVHKRVSPPSYMDKKKKKYLYRIDLSLFVSTIVYIDREGSFLSPRFLSICLCILYKPEYRDINQRLLHVQRQMTCV